MIDLSRLYTQEELEEFDLPNEGLVDYSSSASPPPNEWPVEGHPPDIEDWEDKLMYFGKYKDQTLLTVSQDTGYCNWMVKNGFHQDSEKDKHLRNMLNGYLCWKEEISYPEIDNSQYMDGHNSGDVNPLSIDIYAWLIEMRSEFAPISYTDVGKWLLFFELHDLNERWKQVKHFYRGGFLEGVFEIKCSTAQDNPRASDKSSGVIVLYCCDSFEEERIMEIGRDILVLMELKNKTIYYKTDEQSREGTRVNKDRNHIYKLSL
jgi:hypothetical protein